MALIDPDDAKSTCIIIIILNDHHLNDMKLALSEVKARNAMSIVITDCLDKLDDDMIDLHIEVPSVGDLTSLLPIIPL